MKNDLPDLAAAAAPVPRVRRATPKTKMPKRLTPRQRELLNLILPHLSANRTVRYLTLRKAGLPEEAARLFQSDSDYLDSILARQLQALHYAGWILLECSLITVLHVP